MQIQVLYFGVLKDVLGLERECLETSDGSTVDDVVRLLRSRTSNQREGLWNSLAVAVNRDYAGADTVLRHGDEVALLPPVSGGSGRLVALQQERIESDTVVAALKAGEDGAIVVFDGVVRNNTHGRQTLHLVYEAYEEMALAQLRSLADEAIARFGVRDIAILHRVGKLEIGESSVLIAVASAHRGAAFEACRWIIDTLKKTVPIWKKEHFVDGAVWADGEAFPEELTGAATGVRSE